MSDSMPISEPSVPLLADYDSASLGPLFAVSDEGSAARAIIDAAYGSAKSVVIPSQDPLALGVLLDGERMTSAGEVPIGPEEYRGILSASRGRVLCTTNVGVRVNTRISQPLPEFSLSELASDPGRYQEVYSTCAPFLHTPDGKLRPLTIRLLVREEDDAKVLRSVIETIQSARAKNQVGPAEVHRLALLVVFSEAITSEAQLRFIEWVIDAAAAEQLHEVAIDGDLRDAARKRLGMAGLLNVLGIASLRRLLRYAHSRGVRLLYRYQLDVESAARTIWTGLHAARTHGFVAGKYGLSPMTLSEQRTAIELINRWCDGWTAIPAFYVDTPLVTEDDVYEDIRCAEAAMLWLKAARGAGAKIALFDCPDRITPRRLLRQDGLTSDPGLLALEDVDRIVAFARELGIQILWSGGVTGSQAYELARRGVFGIFSTSSTATKIPVTAAFENDPRLAAENEPTEFGVRKIHAVVQAGFLSGVLRDVDIQLASSIGARAAQLLSGEPDPALSETLLESLNKDLVLGWRLHTGTAAQAGFPARRTRGAASPVPADAVRVFRGYKKPVLDPSQFVRKLESVFMPMTVQMQRLYGLAAYLPAVLPSNHDAKLPDEVALVFYATQNSYHEAKRCIGGRAYGELHELVFDMKASQSEFPSLFEGTIEPNRAYHLFETSVDWQSGASRLVVGRVPKGAAPDSLTTRVCHEAKALQICRGSLDAVIFCVSDSYLLWWEHAPVSIPTKDRFGNAIEVVFAGPPRPVGVPHDLTAPFSGLTLQPSGDFLSMRFPRLREEP